MWRRFCEDGSTALLGFYGGDDPELWDGYLALYKRRIDSDPDDEEINGLAAIPTEAATDYLLELAKRPLDRRQLHSVMRALAGRRSTRAVPHLLDLKARTRDESTRTLIDMALRYLGR